jgi:hypothetical protein
MKMGWLAGSGLGSALATWDLLLHQPRAKIEVGLTPEYCLYFTTGIVAVALFGGVMGLGVGLFVATFLEVNKKR